MEVETPLGLKGKTVTRGIVLQFIRDLAIPIKDDSVHYIATIHACAKRIVGVQVDEKQLDQELQDAFFTSETLTEGQVSVAEEFAARSVQLAFRVWSVRKKKSRTLTSMKELRDEDDSRAPTLKKT